MSEASDRLAKRAEDALNDIRGQFAQVPASAKTPDRTWKVNDVVAFQYVDPKSELKGRQARVHRQDSLGQVHVQLLDSEGNPGGARVAGRLHFPVPDSRHLKLVNAAPEKAPRATAAGSEAVAAEAADAKQAAKA